MFILINQVTGEYADVGCNGQHDVIPTRELASAKIFIDRQEIWEFSQNFGDEWEIEEV